VNSAKIVTPKISGKIHVDRPLVAGLRATQLFGEAGNERTGADFDPEILLLK
jgi:hypothetical protein